MKMISDFWFLEPMKCSQKSQIETSFVKTIEHFRGYLCQNASLSAEKLSGKGKRVVRAPLDTLCNHPELMSDFEVILEINKLCSTLRGVKNVPLITLAKVYTFINYELCSGINYPC